MPCALFSNPTLHTEPTVWGAVASATAARDEHYRVRDFGFGLRTALGVEFDLCPSDASYAVGLDGYFEGSEWNDKTPGAGFGSFGVQAEADLIYLDPVVVGVHGAFGLGTAYLPYRTSGPWGTYEAGVRVGVGPIKLGLDAYTAPAWFPAEGVKLSIGTTGTDLTPRLIALVVAFTTFALAIRAFDETSAVIR